MTAALGATPLCTGALSQGNDEEENDAQRTSIIVRVRACVEASSIYAQTRFYRSLRCGVTGARACVSS